jgi:hypothetical protein
MIRRCGEGDFEVIWSIFEQQAETSVVLVDQRWFGHQQVRR